MASTAAPTAESGPAPFRIRGTLTITRAASIQREIDGERDPLVIDLSGVERMDTVGAWLVYRAVRDRSAKVVGASPQAESLLEQVREFDKPVQVHPEERANFARVIAELGQWMVEVGRTLVGLLGFFGATLVAFGHLAARPRKFRWNAVVHVVQKRRIPRGQSVRCNIRRLARRDANNGDQPKREETACKSHTRGSNIKFERVHFSRPMWPC